MPPYTVEYLCAFRPVWYVDEETGEHFTMRSAIGRAWQIAAARRTRTRIIDSFGRIVWPQQCP